MTIRPSVAPLRWPRDTLYPQKLALTSPTSGGRSVGIVLLRTKDTEFVCLFMVTLKKSIYLWLDSPCGPWPPFLVS
jgi:hypothetical protein